MDWNQGGQYHDHLSSSHWHNVQNGTGALESNITWVSLKSQRYEAQSYKVRKANAVLSFSTGENELCWLSIYTVNNNWSFNMIGISLKAYSKQKKKKKKKKSKDGLVYWLYIAKLSTTTAQKQNITSGSRIWSTLLLCDFAIPHCASVNRMAWQDCQKCREHLAQQTCIELVVSNLIV